MLLTIHFDLRDKERRAISNWWRQGGRWVYADLADRNDCHAFVSWVVGQAIASAEPGAANRR